MENTITNNSNHKIKIKRSQTTLVDNTKLVSRGVILWNEQMQSHVLMINHGVLCHGVLITVCQH